ncbi:MAG: hypothetical protein QOI91_2438 [Solirubrobacteraceae bacterium]|jgi:hypothetical protein|nr:hypothetical protein [Solirubrobacteraceae bacterium]
MSDLVATALITGIVGIAGSITTYFATRRQADRQAEIALHQSSEETQRLRDDRAEAERQNRQGTYHRWITCMDRLSMMASGHRAASEFAEWMAEYSTTTAGVKLFAPAAVCTALDAHEEAMGAFGQDLAPQLPDAPEFAAHLKKIYGQHYIKLFDAESEVMRAMRADVTTPV